MSEARACVCLDGGPEERWRPTHAGGEVEAQVRGGREGEEGGRKRKGAGGREGGMVVVVGGQLEEATEAARTGHTQAAEERTVNL